MENENSSLCQRIEQALESVRPYLRSDGGDVRIHAIHDDFSVELELLGSCESCSMSHMTMKAGLEEAIKKAAPEVVRVSAI
ncbi:MAG TPA: NifU family protein [Bacteroidia bacterium]|nr:NifU family protein [Bacteroidia bacterium]